jgi:hypothetical protein
VELLGWQWFSQTIGDYFLTFNPNKLDFASFDLFSDRGHVHREVL